VCAMAQDSVIGTEYRALRISGEFVCQAGSTPLKGGLSRFACDTCGRLGLSPPRERREERSDEAERGSATRVCPLSARPMSSEDIGLAPLPPGERQKKQRNEACRTYREKQHCQGRTEDPRRIRFRGVVRAGRRPQAC
jgi:hypothetical protein